MKNEYYKECPSCTKNFEARRLNQKFCSDECKIRYNNRNIMKGYHERKNEDAITRDVNKILYHNRQILKQYIGEEISLESIEKQGFKKTFITKFKQDAAEEKMYFFCYDVSYLFTSETKLRVSNIQK